jgi:ribosomal protein S27E
MTLTLQCYRCGAEYTYLGERPHPAQCTACGSSCVPPAGSLTVVNSVHWESANGLAKVWVHSVDERDRPFEFEVAAHGRRGKLVAIKVDGVSINLQIETTLETLPPAVRAEIEAQGITDIEIATTTNSKA